MNENRETNSGAPEMPRGSPTLEEYEEIIARGLPNVECMALALLAIHQQKLYRKGYRSFKEYLRVRWQFSRSRGYQLLHFARLKQMSTAGDAAGPKNERQARRRAADGKAAPQEDEDPSERAMNYLVEVFEKLPQSERREFIDSMRAILRDLEQELNQTNPG